MFDDLASLYQDIVLRHSRTPTHRRTLHSCNAQAQGDNPLCGDRVDVQVNFAADNSIAECAFTAKGCAISIASADMMADAVLGLHPDQVHTLHKNVLALVRTGDTIHAPENLPELRALSGVSEYKSRIKCAILPWAALIAALDGGSHATSEGLTP